VKGFSRSDEEQHDGNARSKGTYCLHPANLKIERPNCASDGLQGTHTSCAGVDRPPLSMCERRLWVVGPYSAPAKDAIGKGAAATGVGTPFGQFSHVAHRANGAHPSPHSWARNIAHLSVTLS
jgi:hypothetical protein